MGKKVLVTGGAGFIGSNLVHLICEQRPDWEVTVIDILSYAGNIKNLDNQINSGQIQFIRADIRDLDQICRIFEQEKFDLVFHLAAESHVDRSIHSAADFVTTNVLGTQVLLDAARTVEGCRFVHISTDEVYGSLGPEGFFEETTPLDPTSPYAASKAASDLLVLAAVKTHGLDGVITRCTNNYGPYQFPEKFIPLFITNVMEDKTLPLYGDGMNVRSWIHVSDHNRALLLVAEKGRAGEVYNIGSEVDGEKTNKEVAESIVKLLGASTDLIQYVTDRLAHDRRYAVTTQKLSDELGWTPTIEFNDGIKETLQWYVENENWWREIKSGQYKDFYDKNYSQRLSAS